MPCSYSEDTELPRPPPLSQLYLMDSHSSLLSLWGQEERVT